MATLYIDGFSGASGDMILGALFDLGIPRAPWEKELRKLPLQGYQIRVSQETRHGIRGTRVMVETASERQPHRSMQDIRAMLEGADLQPEARRLSIRVFQRLAEAEGKIHGVSPEGVTFHEVGALDSIVDVVGSVIAMLQLRPARILSGPLPLGHGFVESRHGVLPVPAPATLEILKGVPVRDGHETAELVTPTGAAIIRELVETFGPLPPMRVERIGYGVGLRDHEARPNLLRLILGEEEGKGLREDWVLESNIDDMNPEFYSHLFDRLMAEGALDVSWSPLMMKKGRPGGLLRVLAEPDRKEALARLIMRESTSIGVRFFAVRRSCLAREHKVVETRWGPVRIKISRLEGEVYNTLPEYEDCSEIARRVGVPLKEVYQEALALYRQEICQP